MNAIVVVDKNWNIGRNNDLLVHLPTDLKYFKEKTTGKVIVIGRKTLESFPNQKPLPNRKNIVLTNNKEYKNAECTVCVGMENLRLELEKHSDKDIYISGGEQVYKLFLEQCDTVYVTKIYEEFPADKSFENLDARGDFQVVWKSEIMNEKDLDFQFFKYVRK